MISCNEAKAANTTRNTCDDHVNITDIQSLRLSSGGYLAIAVFLTVLGIVAFFGNAMVIYVFFKQRLFRRPVNLFILNLAMADLIVSMLGHPLSAVSAYMQRWMGGASACYAYGFICYTCSANSIMTHAVVSYFRYAIVCKYRYVRKVSLSLVLKVLVSVWTYSLFWTVTPLIGWSKYAPEPYNVTCSIEWYGETLADISYVWCCFFFLLVVPLAIMVYSYHGIYKHSSNLRHTAYGNPLPANIHSRFLLELETKVTRVCAFMTLIFMITWSPYAIISIAFAAGFTFHNPAVLLPTMFAKCSCAYNPIIYYYTHDKFKESLKNALKMSRNIVGVSRVETTRIGGEKDRNGRNAHSRRVEITKRFVTSSENSHTTRTNVMEIMSIEY